MSREIKFRFIGQHDESTRIHIIYKTIEELELGGLHVPERFYLIARNEYTGLKDKNGVDIYEGDIIGIIPYYNNPKGAIFSIYFSEDTAQFSYDEDKEKELMIEPLTNIVDECMVIGNIYQYPELLTKQV